MQQKDIHINKNGCCSLSYFLIQSTVKFTEYNSYIKIRKGKRELYRQLLEKVTNNDYIYIFFFFFQNKKSNLFLTAEEL